VTSHIAIILARGGSKRLPRKNILNFHGKPLLAWSIEAALQSGCYDKVLLSTDDPEIASIGEAFGASVPFLREEAMDDFASSSDATLAALGQAEKHWGLKFDLVSQLMANCPLRDAKDINMSVQNFNGKHAESQISCFRFGWMNPWWAAKLDGRGKPDYLFSEARLSRSQDLPNLYCPSGALWMAQADALKAERTFYTQRHVLHELSWMSAMDIDDEEDLEMAKVCYVSKSNL
jgi:N-acylneuraminate cytidylyltransferase